MACHSRIYEIRHQHFSKDRKFEINNENNEVEYIARSKSLTFLEDILLCEASTGKELIEIHKEYFHLHWRYDITSIDQNNGKHQDLATIEKCHDHHHTDNKFQINSIYGVYQLKHNDQEFQLTTGEETIVDVTSNNHCPIQGNLSRVNIFDKREKHPFFLSILIALWCAQPCHHAP